MQNKSSQIKTWLSTYKMPNKQQRIKELKVENIRINRRNTLILLSNSQQKNLNTLDYANNNSLQINKW